jgi:hypothetical protein
MSALQRLRVLIAAEGDPIAGAILEPAAVGAPGTPGAIAAAGPRARSAPDEYELLVEAIYEGYLLHYGVPRIVSGADPDLALLAGDRLYTLGLERLVALGDLEAVRELADVIALCSLLVARGERERCEPLWHAGARAVGWGRDERYADVKSLLRAGAPGAGDALLALDRRAPQA